MSNVFQGAGNLGDTPTLKRAIVNAEPQPVLEMSIYIDRPVPTDNDSFEDRGGFWLAAEIWGKRAEQAATVLVKGARVRVSGVLILDSWTDKESQEKRTAFRLRLDWLAIDLMRIEQLTLKESSRKSQPAAEESAT